MDNPQKIKNEGSSTSQQGQAGEDAAPSSSSSRRSWPGITVTIPPIIVSKETGRKISNWIGRTIDTMKSKEHADNQESSQSLVEHLEKTKAMIDKHLQKEKEETENEPQKLQGEGQDNGRNDKEPSSMTDAHTSIPVGPPSATPRNSQEDKKGHKEEEEENVTTSKEEEFEKFDWKEVEHSIKEGLDNVDWKEVENSIKVGLHSVDWKEVGHSIKVGLHSVDWKEVGHSIKEGLQNVDWKEVGHSIKVGLHNADGTSFKEDLEEDK